MQQTCIRILLLLAAVWIAGCDNVMEYAVSQKLKNSETVLQRFIIATDDTTDLAAPDATNMMDIVLEHHRTESEFTQHKTFFEEGGRAVSYYFHKDSLHHISYGNWEMRGPDKVYLYLTAKLQRNDTIAVCNGVFTVKDEGNGNFVLETDENYTRFVSGIYSVEKHRARLEVKEQ